jgi:predicted transposase YbfD/YdcC
MGENMMRKIIQAEQFRADLPENQSDLLHAIRLRETSEVKLMGCPNQKSNLLEQQTVNDFHARRAITRKENAFQRRSEQKETEIKSHRHHPKSGTGNYRKILSISM